MILNDIFAKPVNRPIEGVIKADDETSLNLEVEEYVLTNEVTKRIEAFLGAYNAYEGTNGVWISGFFGSGKSHLLKMMAFLLENRTIDGAPVLDYFLPKCVDNEFLSSDVKRAVAIPSKSILFNIDQKADVISKTQIDALLSVFVKVFDEMCGYYGKQGHIAQFERDLDKLGLYDKFKKAYRDISDHKWEFGREQALLASQNIDDAYAQVANIARDSAQGILDKYRSEYKVSIEDFAEQVHNYIEKQGPDFRLNFFVDEVGQYIADNVKLMTNLQTMAESLATRCQGRAWLIVTAQEDIPAVIGEMSKQKSEDFSKIQDRFATRMKLTSADVAEVIQKRLLLKNQEGEEMLSELYNEQVNNFGTLFSFTDGSQPYRNYQGKDHFIYSYPFVPYQFPLFQAAIQNLSQHNAFEGRHSSVGERSMLGVFQHVAIQISDHKMGDLATFDLMFEGIRTALKTQIQQSILKAEKHLDNQFAIRVLKALFLVKYIKEFKATIRNICVLMLDSFDADIPSLQKKVEEALNLLEQQTYIQRSGNVYEFLTDEEKDVEQEIKNTEVDTTDVADELAKIIFDSVIKNRKIRYEENGQDYSFSRKLDDKLVGRAYELAVHVVSPFHENSGNESILRSQTLGRDELLVIMPPDARLVGDLLMYKRTEKYIRQNITVTQQDNIKKILNEKQYQNSKMISELQQRVSNLLGKSKLFAAGDEIEISGEEPQSRITRGFYDLVLRTYPNLRMLRGITYTEKDIAKYLQESGETLFGSDGMMLSEPEQEMLSLIQSNKNSGVRTTLKSMVERFERKPYGWYLAAILCILAKICARGKIEVRSDGNLLEDAEIEKALLNTQAHANVVLEPQVDFTASQVRQLKEFFKDFFDAPPNASEAKALGNETAEAFKNLLLDLTSIAAKFEQYPFLKVLDAHIEQIKELSGKPYTFYLTDLPSQETPLLDMKEAILDPIRSFMSGSSKAVYDEARKSLQSQEPNLTYVEGDEVQQVLEILSDPSCFKGNQMQQVKSLIDSLQMKISEQLKQERTEAAKLVNNLRDRINGMVEFTALSSDQQAELMQPFDSFIQQSEHQILIAVIRDTKRQFEENVYPRLLRQMDDWSKIEPTDDDTCEEQPKVEYVPSRLIQVTYEKAWLVDEQDVDRYLTALKEAIMKEIESGKRIQI